MAFADPSQANAGQSPTVKPDRSPYTFAGNYGAESSLLTSPFNPQAYSDDSYGFEFDGIYENGDPKRRRIARACDSCRKKKIKCDAKTPRCSHCENYDIECVFTHVEKKRNPPKGAKYIEGLENRLGRMEALLRMSGLLGDNDDGKTDLGALEQRLAERMSSSRHSSPITHSDQSRAALNALNSQSNSPITSQQPQRPSSQGSPAPSQSRKDADGQASDQRVENLADLFCSLVTNNDGQTRYIGSSSGLSIFSPKGMQWVNEKTGDASFEKIWTNVASQDTKWQDWRPEVFDDIFRRRVFRNLPPKEECFSLLTDYFENFNIMFPLFHQPTFMFLVDRQYSDNPYTGSGWWASLNVALAISYRVRIMKNQIPMGHESNGWAYFKNCLGVLTELTLRNTDLFSVQALLGMCLYLQGTPNPQPSFALVAAAIRQAHAIGLHKRGSGFGLSEAEDEQRKRVFWIAYVVDKDLCIRSGRPPAQDEEDWNVELPLENPSDGVGNVPLPDGKSTVNLFRLMCRFSIISSKVYNRLYSVQASKQSDGELLNTIGELDSELEEWKDSIPLDFRPEHEINSPHAPLVLHVVVLHFAYYNCLTTIHRKSIHHGYWSDRLSEYAVQGLNIRPLNPRVFSSAALCVSAARTSVYLLKYLPQGDYACVWLIIYYPISSLVTIFANILQNPQDARSRTDLKLMSIVTNFLGQLLQGEFTSSLSRVYTICKEFERIAKVVIDRAEKEMTTRQKRKQQKEVEKIEKQTATNPQNPLNVDQVPPKRSAAEFQEDAFTQGNSQTGDNQQIFNSHLLQTQHPGDQMGFTSIADDPSFYTQTSPSTNGLDLLEERARNYMFQGGQYDMLDPNNPELGTNSLNVGSFQQPFVPQDLWSMPMTFEWDWADMQVPPS